MIKKPVALINDFSGGQDTKTPIISMGLNKSPNMRNFHCAGVKERLVKRGGHAKINSLDVNTDDLDTHYPPGYQTYDYPLRTSAAYTQISQGFKPNTTGEVTKVRLWLKSTGTPAGTDTLTLEIQSDNSGVPSGVEVTNGVSSTVDISDTLTSSYAWVTFTFATNPSLVAGTQYHLVLQGAFTISSSNYVSWGADNFDVLYCCGSMSQFDSSLWTAVTNCNACFEVFIDGGINGNDGVALYDFASKGMLLGFFGTSLYKMDKNSVGTPDGTWDGLIIGSTTSGVIENMEYSTNALAEAAYVSNADPNLIAEYATGSNTLLIHFNGVDGATTHTAATGQVVTFIGTAQLDTAQKKFGTASLLLDGNSDYVTLPESANWDFGSGDFTIDFWIKFNSTAGTQGLIWQYDDTNNYQYLQFASNVLSFYSFVGGVTKASYTFAYTPTANFDHIALVRNGTTVYCFINGKSVTPTVITAISTNSLLNSAQVLSIGAQENLAGGNNFVNGWIDEVRILKGTAVWTSNFQLLQPSSESTLKTQGSYSLEVFAAITNSLNKTLTKTIGSPIDLTSKTTIYFDIYASRTGANIKIGIHDSGGTTSEKTYTVAAANTWETVTWDISAVADADKNAIDSIIITIVNADADNTFYLDNMFAIETGTESVLTSSRYLTFADWQSGRALINTDVGLYSYTGTGNAGIVTNAPISKFLVIFRNYVFAAGIRGLPNTIRYSDLSDYTTWTAANVLTVNTNDGDVITGMRILKGKLYIFKRYSIHRVTYLGSNPTFQVDQILGVGCPAHYTIKEVELGSDVGTVLVFLTTDKKLAVFDGYNVQIINDSLTEETNDLFGSSDDQPLSFSDINLIYADLFHAVVKTDTSEYILYCVLGTDTAINYAFVFDYKTGGIYPYDGQPFSSSCYAISTNKSKILYCAGYTGYMWQQESGNSDDGSAINAYWVSAKIKPQLVSLLMKALKLGLNIKESYSVSTLNAYFQFRIDWNVSWTDAEAFAYNRADVLTLGGTREFEIGTIENMLQIKIYDNSTQLPLTLYGVDLFGEPTLGASVGERATA